MSGLKSVAVKIEAEDHLTEHLEEAFQVIVRWDILDQYAYRMGQQFRVSYDYDLFVSFTNVREAENEFARRLMWKRFREGRDGR